MLSNLAWSRLQAAACACVLCAVLVAALYPFNPIPRNNVTWLTNSAGLHFDWHGTVMSSREFPLPVLAGFASCSIELWAEADPGVTSGTLLGFYNPGHPASFIVRQYRQELVFQRTLRTGLGEGQWTFMAVEAFHAGRPSVITIVASPQARAAYVDGILQEKSTRLAPFCTSSTGWLVLGTSPVSDSGWRGTLHGLAIFGRDLSAAEVLNDFHSWKENGRPSTAANEDLRALYLFDERAGDVVHNRAGNGPDLTIPNHYLVPFKPFLQAPWKEFRPTLDFLSDALVNVAGFIPFGFVFCSYFTTVRRLQRAQLITILLGFLVSLTVETLQGFLPTRGSGVTDIITNTAGTAIGTMLFRWRPIQALYSRFGIWTAQ